MGQLRQHRVTLTSPGGEEYDISSRVSLESIGRITYEIEEDLLQITYSDITLTVADPTGEIFALFEGVARGDAWEVIAERETGRDDLAWERIFGGLVEVPTGVKRDRSSMTVTLQVFGFAKLLELASAEDIKRTLDETTVSGSAGDQTLTFTAGDTTLLEVGDSLQISADGKTETVVVQSITDSTHLETTEDLQYNHTDAALTLETPYYRNTSLEWLSGQLFGAAGISDTNIQLPDSISSVPFLSPLNSEGISSLTPSAIVEKSDKLSVFSIVSGVDKRYDADTISSGFGAGTSEAIRADWKPYRQTAPATYRDAGDYDDGSRAWDYDGGDYYALGHATGSLTLKKNGTTIATVDSSSGYTYRHRYVDFFPALGEVWVSFSGSSLTTWKRRIECYDTSGTLLREFPDAGGGGIRSIDDDELIAVDSTARPSLTVLAVGPIVLYNADGPVLTLEARSGVQMWTFKKMGSLGYFAVRFESGKTYVTNWGTDGQIVSDNLISGTESARAYGAVFDGGGALTPAYVCFGGGVWYAFSTEFSGLVPYANFAGQSCSAAARELAKMGGCYLYVDEYKTAHLLGRNCAKLNEAEPYELPALLEAATDWPLSEWYRRSVQVTGSDEAGDEVSVIAGEGGDTANRLEIDLQMPLTSGFASSIAWAYVEYLSGLGRQIDGASPIPADRTVKMLDRVIVEGVTWRVLRVEHDLESGQLSLRLVEEGV